MSFSFNPLSDEQIIALSNQNLLPDGDYDFEVVNAVSSYSDAGNAMIKVTLSVKCGKEARIITDYLVASEKMMFKLKHFCESIGLENEYKSGNFLVSGCITRVGRAKIVLEKGKPRKDGDGFYQDKNAVKDYIVLLKVVEDFNDDIKF